MRTSIILLSTTAATLTSAAPQINYATSGTAGGVVPLGGNCTPNQDTCALGSQCYATSSMLQPRCGNLQAACTINEQCAFNTCNVQQGLCNGFLSSIASPSSTAISMSTTSGSAYVSVTTTSSSPVTMGSTSATSSLTSTAAAGTLPLGATCNATTQTSQCSGGVKCWTSNAGLVARCGNFNAACTSSSQCAFNVCNNGLCNGLLPSGAGNATMTVRPTGSTRPTSSDKPSGSVTPYTGAASVVGAGSWVLAVVFGVGAWLL